MSAPRTIGGFIQQLDIIIKYYEINPDQKHPVNCYGKPPTGVSLDSSSLARLQDTHNSSTYSSS